jgi:hypothetical protein
MGYRIAEDDPGPASIVGRVAVTIEPDGWRRCTEAASTMTCDEEVFTVTTQLDACEGETRAHTWADHFRRDGV